MANMEIIREWDNRRLISELRSQLRATVPDPATYMPLIVETLARMLEIRDGLPIECPAGFCPHGKPAEVICEICSKFRENSAGRVKGGAA